VNLRDSLRRLGRKIRRSSDTLAYRSRQAGDLMLSVLEQGDEALEKAFELARLRKAPAPSEMPVDFALRDSPLLRKAYETIVPVSHVFRMGFRHDREYLEDFMPISNEAFIGRGSYKFVYHLPWQMVVKVSKEVLPSDPLFGSLFREVDRDQSRFLKNEELDLQEFLGRRRRRYIRDRLRFKFNRLGLERYSYWKVREALPDLVLPTRFFMGLRCRHRMFRTGHYEKITPMDSQIMLIGKHLKEFARAARPSQQSRFMSRFAPRFDFVFDTQRFGRIKKKVLVKITEDFKNLIRYTELLATREKMILDIHSENIIITLPDFQLKIFDFHLFDEHLYEPSLVHDRPEKDHIELIEKFLGSLESDSE